MTHRDTTPDIDGYPITRRTALKATGVAAGGLAFGGVGLQTFAGRAAASSHVEETLYLTDSGGDNGGNFLTKLYEVTLTDDPFEAQLDLVYELTDTDFDQVDAIAASLDGTTIYMVDKNSRHLGTYDVDADAFTDHGAISGLPGGVVLAAFGPDGVLYVVSQNDNTIYAVDPSGPTATAFVTVTGASVTGADIAFDADGVLYLYSSSAQTLYTVDYDDGSASFGEATLVGETGDFFTGLAVRDDGAGDLVGSNTTRDEIVVVSKTDGSQGTRYPMYIGDTRYAYGYGDMTVGRLDICECPLEESIKFEYDEDTDAFVPEDWMGEEIGYVSYTGDAGEPMHVTFDTEYCGLYALVKSGQEFEVQALETMDGQVVVDTANDEKYAISFVEFFCDEQAAIDAMAAFPSRGRGGGRPD